MNPRVTCALHLSRLKKYLQKEMKLTLHITLFIRWSKRGNQSRPLRGDGRVGVLMRKRRIVR
jgi:hypothetical protein